MAQEQQQEPQEQQQEQQQRGLLPSTIRACDIAAGRAEADPAAPPIAVKGAWRNLSCKMSGSECYRRVLREGNWQWVSERLGRCDGFAGSRGDARRGDVWEGELVAQYGRSIVRGRAGAVSLDAIYVVRRHPDGEPPLRKCAHVRRRDGQVDVTLPDGTVIPVPSPDWR